MNEINYRNLKSVKAFTLVELIIVVAIVAVLAGAIFVAVDPARRLHEVRNARRSVDATTILDAVRKYQVDNEGDHYTEIAGMTVDLYYQIGTAAAGCGMTCYLNNTSGDCVDLSAIGSNYLASVPYDPKDGTVSLTTYAIKIDTNGAITVAACNSEGEGSGGDGTPPTITISR